MSTPISTPTSTPTSTTSAAPAAIPSADELRAALRALTPAQDHLLRFHDRLTPDQQLALRRDIASLDRAALPALIARYVTTRPTAHLSAQPAPVRHYPHDHTSSAGRGSWDRAAYHARGVELIANGQVAAFTVAGGQGSRLGYEGPKGCFPAGAVSNKPLFACLADWILAAQARHCPRGITIPWYIMTSPQNHEATIAFFNQHNHFGLRPDDLFFFPQGVMPSFDAASGSILLDSPHALSLNPDGHGGSLKALHASGALDHMAARGVRHISYTQIDNPLVRVIDPAFLGLHAFAPDSSGEMSSKMVAKANPGERVGVLCSVDNRTCVIEYSDLPKHLAEATNPDASLRFNAGSIAIHIIRTDFVRRLNTAHGGFSLPYHRADKKVPFIDLNSGNRVDPQTPNAVKLETFVFDALPLAQASIVLETDRVEEFAPIKNATGADSPETCRQLQTKRAARWLTRVGVRVPLNADNSPNCTLELSPRTALYPDDLKAAALPGVIPNEAKLVL
jgi:UDP-N-acetylglucosamine/UDP-N-acetylgalactosamine diphosphorylase